MRKHIKTLTVLCALALTFAAPMTAYAHHGHGAGYGHHYGRNGHDYPGGSYCPYNDSCPNRTTISSAADTSTAQLLAKKKYKLSKKLYKKLGGWWTDVSSGGYDRKITRKKVKIFSRTTGKCIGTMKICGCKKVKGRYILKLKNSSGTKLCYRYDKKADVLENYYNGWKADPNYYSGSSSMFRGKWK